MVLLVETENAITTQLARYWHAKFKTIWSLGGISKVTTKEIEYTDKFGNKQQGKLAYKVALDFQSQERLFFQEKRKHLRIINMPIFKSEVVSVDFVGKKEAQCIYIDHPDHLYITDNFVVTHNTETPLGLPLMRLLGGLVPLLRW